MAKLVAWERAPSDGVFIRSKDFSILTYKAPISPKALATYLHYRAYENQVTSVLFDIKQFSLTSPPARDQHRNYQYHLQRDAKDQDRLAKLFILKFAYLAHHLILLPRTVWIEFTRSHQTRVEGAGVINLALGTLPSLSPFTVHERDFSNAIDSWMNAAAARHIYRNPTTGVELIGYKPQLTSPSSIVHTATQSVRSYNAISFLRQKIRESRFKGADFCLNPLAPLFADFHIRISSTTPEDSHLLRIEHKLGQITRIQNGVTFYLFSDKPRRSPIHPSRQWHWLIFQPEERMTEWFCFGRHEIKSDWYERWNKKLKRSEPRRYLTLKYPEFMKYRYQDVKKMLQYM